MLPGNFLGPILHPPLAAGCARTHGVYRCSPDEELLCILNEKLRHQHLTAGVDALLAASCVLAKRRATASHFGNGGEVSNLLSEAMLRKQRRGDGSKKSRRAHGSNAVIIYFHMRDA